MGKSYIKAEEYHAVMVECKKSGVLSKRAIELFRIHSQEASRKFTYAVEEDRDDCVARAMEDLLRYWKNFKESNVLRLEINRNFSKEDSILLKIENHGDVTFVPVKDKEEFSNVEDEFVYPFYIGSDINKTLSSIKEEINKNFSGVITAYVDKIKNTLTLMDVHNGHDLDIRSRVLIENRKETFEYHPRMKLKFPILKEPFLKVFPEHSDVAKVVDIHKILEKNPEEKIEITVGLTNAKTKIPPIDGREVHEFKNPSNAFSYFTTIVSNGIRKQFNKLYPIGFKECDIVYLSINSRDGGSGYYGL